MTEEAVTLVAAIAFSIVGAGALFHYYLMVAAWPLAVGRVIGNEAEKRTDHGFDEYAYFPRIEFTAADGNAYAVKGDIGKTEEWPIGELVRLHYRPSNPNHTSIASGWQRLVFAGAFVGFAIASWFAVVR